MDASIIDLRYNMVLCSSNITFKIIKNQNLIGLNFRNTFIKLLQTSFKWSGIIPFIRRSE